MKIGIDIDDTITDSWECLIPHYAKLFKIPEEILQTRTTEYKIGNTTYMVTTTFSPEFKQSLSDIIQRMIIRDSDEILDEKEYRKD